ncbi:MAG TPA: Fur family transcriptional regulator [Gammaproteobacteria bacterium]|nr:Fur family transcriptional regulator [Gammaproteobacteria bacterium]
MSGGRHQAFPARGHDHGSCIDQAMANAAAVCAERGARLTVLRRRVLEILWRSHRPLGAYEILEVLSREGRSSAPPTVYRALDFLLGNGLVHRIASRNAYVGCSRPGHSDAGQFLICEACGVAAEVNNAQLEQAIGSTAESVDFAASEHTVEISGRCPNCRRDRAS